jgi:hypothetical protein
MPEGWSAQEDSECVTFQAAKPIGALQISAAKKSTGSVTEAELRDFTKDDSLTGVKLAPVTCGEFTGFTSSLTKDGRSWLKHWLRHGEVVVFVTYNVVARNDREELRKVRSILESLKRTD